MLASADGAALATDAAAKDFVTDAHAHCKFIGHVDRRRTVQAAGVADLIDDGYVALDTAGVDAFVTACRAALLDREPTVDTA